MARLAVRDLRALVERALAAAPRGLSALGLPRFEPGERADALAALASGPWALVDLEGADDPATRRALEAAWDAEQVVALADARAVPGPLLTLIEALEEARPTAAVGTFEPLLVHTRQRWLLAVEGAPAPGEVPARLARIARWDFA
jgi:hypothetical protein